MARFLSRSCEYAIQAVLYLSSRGNGAPTVLRDISESLSIPHHFLSKVMQQLTRAGILDSHKGTTGGFVLTRPSSAIALKDIIEAVDGPGFLDECVLGFPNCDDNNPCPVHEQWKHARELLLAMVSTKTVDQLGKNIEGKLEFIEQLKKKQ